MRPAIHIFILLILFYNSPAAQESSSNTSVEAVFEKVPYIPDTTGSAKSENWLRGVAGIIRIAGPYRLCVPQEGFQVVSYRIAISKSNGDIVEVDNTGEYLRNSYAHISPGDTVYIHKIRVRHASGRISTLKPIVVLPDSL